jgi:hypothetical protein
MESAFRIAEGVKTTFETFTEGIQIMAFRRNAAITSSFVVDMLTVAFASSIVTTSFIVELRVKEFIVVNYLVTVVIDPINSKSVRFEIC